MEMKSIPGLIVMAAIAIILVGSLMMPVITDAIDGEQDTFTNGTDYAEYYSGDCTIVVTPTSVTFNGEALTLASYKTYVSGDSMTIISSAGTISILCQNTSKITVNNSSITYTITVEDGTATINNGTTDVATFDCNGFYMHSSTPTAKVFQDWGRGIYYNSLADVFSTTLNGTAYCAMSGGKVYINGTEADSFSITSGTAAASGYDNLNLSSGAVVVACSLGSNSYNTTYYTAVCDANVSATVSGTVETGAIAMLLLAIPPMIIIAIVVAFVMKMSKND